ncbi:hypothetical protein Tco_0970462 [Tanacetum coccineum]
MEYVKKSINERAQHKQDYDIRMNERHMQSKEGKVDSSKALDTGSVVAKSNGTESDKPVNDQVPFAEVDINTTPDSTNMSHRGGEIDQRICPAKPHHVNAPSSSKNSQKESYGSNDMAHTYFLKEGRKKTQDRNRIPNPRDMASARTHRTPNACTPKPRNISRCLHVSKISCVTSNDLLLVDHSRKSSSFLDSKHFVCSTCQKCVFNANHDACVTKFLNEVNSHARKPSHKTTTRYKPIEKTRNTKKSLGQILTGHMFSTTKSSAVKKKTNNPRSCLRWKPMGRGFITVGLRWLPMRKLLP